MWYLQWWILGEANEAVASGPRFLGAPLENIVSFRCRCFLEIIMKLRRKVGNTRSIRDEDLFFGGHYDFGSKTAKSEMKSK